MSISTLTIKRLWGRSGNRCAFPDCRTELFFDDPNNSCSSNTGDIAHMSAREPGGPRWDSNLADEERDAYDNLMLLCQKHHRLVDQNPNKFSVDLLREYKKKHEAWVKDNLSLDFDKQDTDEIYSTYIDEICRLADFNDWQNWASSLVSDGQPSINKDSFERLKKLSLVLLGMVWPKRNQNREIESSIKNFNFVLKDLIFVFSKYKIGYFNSYITEKIYKIYDGNPELYNKLGKLFDFHVDLVEDLALELTRAGNFLSDQVRKYLNPFFRIKEGLLLITSGPNMDKYLSIITHRVEYSEKDIKDGLYKSLEDFMINRVNRDLHFGEGVNGDYD